MLAGQRIMLSASRPPNGLPASVRRPAARGGRDRRPCCSAARRRSPRAGRTAAARCRGSPASGRCCAPGLAAHQVEPRDRGQQAHRVGMQRPGEQLADLGLLDLAAGIHDDDPPRRLGDDAEIVGDQDHRGAELALQLDDQFEDLRLDGDVERRGRLVGDQHLGIAGERHGDHGALAHAARELVRIFLGALGRLGDAHQVEHLDGALAALPCGPCRGAGSAPRRSACRWSSPD